MTIPTGPDAPRFAEDFPVDWDKDHYVTRREMTKFLTLGSVLLALANVAIAVAGRFVPSRRGGARVRIAAASDLPVGGSLLFRYPTDEDPCILVRGADGALSAYSQVCTHLSCAVVHRGGDELFCPCHHGLFSARDGRPTGGPPTRRLPRILVEQQGGDIFAIGREA